MTVIDEQGRPEPPMAADELATLTGFLDFQRATFEWKCSGLDAVGLAVKVAASSLTLGGLLKHMAVVEDGWFCETLLNRKNGMPWDDVDWEAHPDWSWRTAAENSPEELLSLWRRSVDASRAAVADALADGGLEQLALREWPPGQRRSLRWILCHMIQEYARHNGHADLIRESIDGQIGE